MRAPTGLSPLRAGTWAALATVLASCGTGPGATPGPRAAHHVAGRSAAHLNAREEANGTAPAARHTGKHAAGTATAKPGAGAAPAYFHTLRPGAKLPSSAQCATWVRARPLKENKGVNRPFNKTTGQHVGSSFFAGDQPAAGKFLAPRINGDFTGTTQQILRWAACKWGIDQNIVFAQAAVESWWRQTTKGDWETSGCPPGHGPGKDGRTGLCPQSWGILQNRYPFEKQSWPGIARSTAMNADTAYAIWRSCFDGYETWLNTVEHTGKYHAGDAWGCVGRWFAGRWHTAPAQTYIKKVQSYDRQRIWTTKDFQQP